MRDTLKEIGKEALSFLQALLTTIVYMGIFGLPGLIVLVPLAMISCQAKCTADEPCDAAIVYGECQEVAPKPPEPCDEEQQ